MEKREPDKRPGSFRNADVPDPRWEWAEERTEWAEQRTLMAKERTFAAWVRTGLAIAATGMGFGQFLRNLEPGWLVKGMTALMVVAAIITFGLGFWRHHKASTQLEFSGIKRTPRWTLVAITLALIVASLLGLIAIIR